LNFYSNAFNSSIFKSLSDIFLSINNKNPLKSIVPINLNLKKVLKKLENYLPVLSLSNSFNNLLISSFFGSNPSALKATLISLTSIVPVPSASNKSNASRSSCFCLSLNSSFIELPFLVALLLLPLEDLLFLLFSVLLLVLLISLLFVEEAC
jgi:hypothetical protein